ncbi:MAG TPA: BrxE family protein [Actinomycetota bacterium]|nr:BrxE family protein [Actinomycetota bacterium]
MDENIEIEWAVLVLAVARLGEVGFQGWSGSHGLGQAGRYVLERALPRTWKAAGLELDLIAAARRHDEALPRPTALHLFSDRLPFRATASAWISERKTAPSKLLDQIASWDLDSLAAEVMNRAGSPLGGEMLGGARRLGQLSPADLEDREKLTSASTQMAASYLAGNGFAPAYFDLT